MVSYKEKSARNYLPITLLFVLFLFAIGYLAFQNFSLRADISSLEAQIAESDHNSSPASDVRSVQANLGRLVDGFDSEYSKGKEDGYVDGFIDGYLRGYNEAAEQSNDIDPIDDYTEKYLKMRELRDELTK